ncbi:CubicO group peptidase, beta-lactamase class C family [Devosia sp. YR412]|uniref:serine hydrolase n=1 Tax=Devosia sp. YR412 TaxID=1881030 RepID=UPI0008CD6043|nr:serine hydrolase [Devosia sp. YR412]SEQ24632.1 CubicO group peptidase, beta-lactamase class C family [Devosia sp. YR412]
MRFTLAALAFAALAVSPSLAQEAVVTPDPAQIISDRITRDGQGIGIATAVVEDDVPSFASHGVLAAGGPTSVDEHTLFEIGSISKIFTNLLLAQLVLEGKIDLDAPVSDYLPEGTMVPEFEGKPITLFDLATHTSGLPSIPPELALADPANPYQFYSVDLLNAFLAAFPLPRAPGEKHEYSNIGTTLIGLAVSHVAGQSYEQMVQQRILDPLGMEDTTLVVPEDKLPRFASGHAQGQPAGHWDFDVFAPAGGWRSTATDMAKFIAAASGQTETPLKPAFDLMLERTRPAGSPAMSIGLGWMILQHAGGQIVWHNGMTGGFNAFAGYDRNTGRAAVVLANAISATGIEDIGFHLIDPTAPLTPQPQPRTEVQLDPAVLDNYVGDYELGPEFQIAVTVENGQLYVQASGQDRFPAFPESETIFFLKVVDAQISFETGADGKATGLILHQNGQDISGTRK